LSVDDVVVVGPSDVDFGTLADDSDDEVGVE
jgi:hypothetical protein